VFSVSENIFESVSSIKKPTSTYDWNLGEVLRKRIN